MTKTKAKTETKSLEKLIKEGKFDYVNPNLTEDNFPKQGEVCTDLGFKSFPGEIKTGDEVLEYLKKNNLEPATAHDLFAYLSEHPDKPERLRGYIAFGLIFLHEDKRKVALAWRRWGGFRGAGVSSVERGFGDRCWFVFRRKSLDTEASGTDPLNPESLELRVQKLEEQMEALCKFLVF